MFFVSNMKGKKTFPEITYRAIMLLLKNNKAVKLPFLSFLTFGNKQSWYILKHKCVSFIVVDHSLIVTLGQIAVRAADLILSTNPTFLITTKRKGKKGFSNV
jgi:hypothetical protein